MMISFLHIHVYDDFKGVITMFEVDKKKIGEHIAELIEASEYKSDRQFGIAYLNRRYGSLDEAAIPNIQNRICQIKKGKLT